MNPVNSFLPHLETVVSFLVAAFLGFSAWRFWRFVRPLKSLHDRRPFIGGVVFMLGWWAWVFCFLGMGVLSILYPFDVRGVIAPPAGSLGATLAFVVYALLPVGIVLMATGFALWGLRLRTPTMPKTPKIPRSATRRGR